MRKHLQKIKLLTDQPTKRLAYRKTLIKPKNVQEHVRYFDSCFPTCKMLKNLRKWNLGQADRPTAL